MKSFKKPSREEIKKMLTDEQFRITQENGTERAFTSSLHNNKEPGLYVDVVSNEPLFSSKDKFDSGTGWPSFSKPITKSAITTNLDFKILIPRREVRSKLADSHLGHVFNDGPAPTGKRYCMNGAALTFIPKKDMKKKGYGEWLKFV